MSSATGDLLSHFEAKEVEATPPPPSWDVAPTQAVPIVAELIPTWNHVTAHLYGTPEVLSDEENYAMLGLLTDHFEKHQNHGRSLSEDEAMALVLQMTGRISTS
jgi:transcriptional regulator